MHIQDRKHAVIIGAGFGGLEAAKALSNEEIDVTLIDRHNYHLFQPLLYQVATSALASAEIAAPIRHILRKCKNITVFMDSVEGIDAKANKVTTKANGQISYDYLVLATGARHSYFGKDEWEDIAPGLKTIDDAFKLRHRILSAFEKAEMEKDEEKKHAYLNFVIVGAGPTGCELAGAIAELARHSLTDDFRNITPKCAKIKLVEGGPRVLAAFDEKLALKAQKNLEKMGVEVITNTIVGDIKPGEVKMGDDILKVETIIWAAGVQASPAGQWLDAETDRSGRVIVGENLSVPGHSNIFAVGDTAAYTLPGDERPLPGVAPVAKQMGKFVGKYILAKVQGKNRLPKFKYNDYGNMATIGRNKAIAELGFMKVSGFIGWWLWGLAHVYFLVGFGNRITVSMKWLWSYLTWQRGVRIISGAKE